MTKQSKTEKLARTLWPIASRKAHVRYKTYEGFSLVDPTVADAILKQFVEIARFILRREARIRRESMEMAIEAVQHSDLSSTAMEYVIDSIRAAFKKGTMK